MGVYCYRIERTGEPIELDMSLDEMRHRQFDMRDGRQRIRLADGRVAVRDFAAEWSGVRQGHAPWPLYSDAMGVHPSQVEQAHANSVEVGVETFFDKHTGQAIFESRAHRKRYCHAIAPFFGGKQIHDHDGGYGDP